MDLNFGNTLLQTWYDGWIVVLGFVVAIVLAVLVVSRANWQTNGLLIKTAMVVSALVVMPLALAKIGLEIGIDEDNPDPIGYISLLAFIASVAVGASYLYLAYRQERQGAEPAFQEIVTPEDGTPLPPVDDDATRTLTAGGTIVESPPIGGVTDAGAMAPTQAPAAWVHFKSGPRAGQSIPLNPGLTSIGRGPDNDVVVDDAAVSREHATIAYEGGQFIVEDAGSSSGTIVEGSPAAQTVLTSGSSIQLGETELVFMQAEGTFAAAAGAPAATGAGGQQPGETLVMQPQAAAVMAWLAVTGGPEKGKTYQLTAADTTIGRDTTNDFVLADAAVSRRHVMLKYQDDKFILLDVGSASGTKVNNKTVTGKSLAAGGVIQIGQTQLTLVDVEAGEAAPQASASDATMVSQPESGGGVLIVQSGPDSGKSFPLVQGENTIGRDNDCQIILTDQTVSRQHAMVRRQDESCTVHDLGSRTGTRVDGETLTELTLSSGDTISIGRSELTLMQVEQPK